MEQQQGKEDGEAAVAAAITQMMMSVWVASAAAPGLDLAPDRDLGHGAAAEAGAAVLAAAATVAAAATGSGLGRPSGDVAALATAAIVTADRARGVAGRDVGATANTRAIAELLLAGRGCPLSMQQNGESIWTEAV